MKTMREAVIDWLAEQWNSNNALIDRFIDDQERVDKLAERNREIVALISEIGANGKDETGA